MLQRRELVGQLRSTFGKTETTITRSPRLRDRRFARFIRQQLTLHHQRPLRRQKLAPRPAAIRRRMERKKVGRFSRPCQRVGPLACGLGVSGQIPAWLEKTSQPAAATKRSGSQVAGGCKDSPPGGAFAREIRKRTRVAQHRE